MSDGEDFRPTRRIGRWSYGDHPGLNPGWRLDGTNLVLDFDPLNRSGTLTGAYQLWTDGRPGEFIDHYLDGAMSYVESTLAVPRGGEADAR